MAIDVRMCKCNRVIAPRPSLQMVDMETRLTTMTPICSKATLNEQVWQRHAPAFRRKHAPRSQAT